MSSIGHKKHLLNIQYRMYPSISRFSNAIFYDNQILDGQNIKGDGYLKSYIPRKMYGPDSFIDMGNKPEVLESVGSGRKNNVEVDAIFSMLQKLSNGTFTSTSLICLDLISSSYSSSTIFN